MPQRLPVSTTRLDRSQRSPSCGRQVTVALISTGACCPWVLLIIWYSILYPWGKSVYPGIGVLQLPPIQAPNFIYKCSILCPSNLNMHFMTYKTPRYKLCKIQLGSLLEKPRLKISRSKTTCTAILRSIYHVPLAVDLTSIMGLC